VFGLTHPIGKGTLLKQLNEPRKSTSQSGRVGSRGHCSQELREGSYENLPFLEPQYPDFRVRHLYASIRLSASLVQAHYNLHRHLGTRRFPRHAHPRIIRQVTRWQPQQYSSTGYRAGEFRIRQHNRGTMTQFSWSECRKSHRTSVRIAGDPSEIRTEHLSNTSLKFYRCANPPAIHDRVTVSPDLILMAFRR
jgi:hypothetical protein